MSRDILSALGHALHAAQKERSHAVLFASIKQKSMKQKNESVSLQDVFAESDGHFDRILKGDRAAALSPAIALIKEQRPEILRDGLGPAAIVNLYSHKIIGPLISAMTLSAFSQPDVDPAQVNAYVLFLQMKEKFAQEQALGIRGLVAGAFDNAELRDRFYFLIAEQENIQQNFLDMADPAQTTQARICLDSDSLSATRAMAHCILSAPAPSSAEWLTRTTETMALMQQAEKNLVQMLAPQQLSASSGKTGPESDKETGAMTNSYSVGSITAKQRRFIKLLPFFKDLPDDVSNGLLQYAQARDYRKGQILFLEGEQSSQLYIVLSGWITLFKGTARGDESVLQMLTQGEMVAESAVFLNEPYPVSAQVARPSVVLSLPASIMRERIKDHNDLALRILTDVSRHSHSLIQEFENIRLKPVVERVGWFLLKLLLNQSKVPDLVELPYDKALIASYLDMKPETFSRTLKHFKDMGFKINRNVVILPDDKALCRFCDTTLASRCPKYHSSGCVQRHNQAVPDSQ